ncbi:MAG: transketolase [Candidatus Thorarchaeota archaeon]
MSPKDDLQEKALNTIRFLAVDAIEAANSGHPGMPMGTAAMAYTLWTRHMRYNPKNPDWPNRDRFVLSGGHGSMLLYALLHLTGYDVSLEDIKNFRQWESKTPGHPECWMTPGVEVTTGPLGQGFGNSVGMAIGEKHLASVFNRSGHDIIDHYTYAIVTDGDLMEGISYETSSLAGHFSLGKLIMLYDDNRISIDGSTDITFTEDRQKRFEAQGWHVQVIADGNNVDAIDDAIMKAKKDSRPSIIICRTIIGFGLPTKQNTSACHGSPAGKEELEGAKKALGWPLEPTFHIPEDVLAHYRQAIERGKKFEDEWNHSFEKYKSEHPELALELEKRLAGELPDDWEQSLPEFEGDQKGIPTRSASGKVINAIAPTLKAMMGGSADLTGSNKTWIGGSDAFQAGNPEGRNFFFGVREHAMGAIVNGLAAHGGFIPYTGTFLVFSDYMRPAIRISALSGHQSIWVFTHDSIGLGEDGPTHQPIEHISALRAIPNLVVIRPSDANEVAEAWRLAITRKDGPTLMALTRQNVPILDRSKYTTAKDLEKGAYVLTDLGEGDPQLILMASGSEVGLIVEAGEQLAKDGISVRLVSFPSWELFAIQDKSYRDSVIPPSVKARLVVEAGVSQGWERWIGEDGKTITMDSFGASAPSDVLFEKFGFSVENIIEQSKKLL